MIRTLKLQTPRWAYIWILCAVMCAVSGCANLDAVRNFANISADTADYQQLVNEYASGPILEKRYAPERAQPGLDAIAHAREGQKERLLAAQKVIVTYMATLGALADDKLPDVDKESDALEKSLEKSEFLAEGDAQAGKKSSQAAATIVSTLTRSTTDHWRQGRIKKILKEVDPSFQTTIEGLKAIIDMDFSAALDEEREAIYKYFNAAIADAKARGDTEGLPPIAKVVMEDKLSEIEIKRTAIKTYAKQLETIAQGHKDLASHVDNLSNKELARRLKGYANDLKALNKAVKDI